MQLKQRRIDWFWSLVRKCGLGAFVICFYPRSYLLQRGWFKSFRKGIPIDRGENALPWWPYPAIDFLAARIRPGMRVFEFGCGYSTLWFTALHACVRSVDDSLAWADKIRRILPEADVTVTGDAEAYVGTVSLGEAKYDIILVDGVFREACLVEALRHLSESGVVLVDDSAREYFRGQASRILRSGFKEITFTGLTPSHFIESQITILYRSGNCLCI